MANGRAFAGTAVGIGALTLLHAALTWPPAATAAFFGGGALIAFAAEAVVIRLDWLDHRVGPQVAGVPAYVLFGWTGTIYVAFQGALLVSTGWTAVVLAGVLATGYDILTDHRGVAEGYWSYTDTLPGPRRHGVPWWNFLGWFLISCLTAGLALPAL
jgi:hypothetical protein